MEVSINRIDTANASASAVVSIEKMQEAIENIAKEAAKTINIPGFRKGKIPTSVIKSRYGEKLQEDANSQILRDVLDKAVAELQVAKEALIGEPLVSKFDKSEDKIDIELKICIKPEIKLEGYQKAIPQIKEDDVSDKEINERIEALAKSKAPNKEVTTNRALKKDDFATIDFEGFVDEKAIEGGKESGFVLQIGSKVLVEGFEEQLIGMKKGETRTITVTFPQDYRSSELAGKEATFNVTLHKIEVKETPKIDDELAKELLPNEKEATLDMLKEKVKEQLKSEKKNKLYNDELKPKVLEELASKYEFDLPEIVVEQEIELNFRNALNRLTQAEIEELKDNEAKLKELRESHREMAQKSVKVTFMIDALAKLEGVDVTNEELVNAVYYEAMSMGQDPKKTFAYYRDNGLLPAIKMAMVEDKLLTHLLDKKLKGEI